MWMMGCSDVSDSFVGRKVRPHIPRPTIINPAISPSTSNINNVAANHPYLGRIHGGDLLVYNHHLLTEQSKRDYDVPTLVSSRWNPTPEQLQTLEELYRRGTRTPSAEQIQHITAQLRRFGKIEGKNVFYWFQNHKARERQKRRRRSELTEEDELQLPPLQHAEIFDNKESGSSRTSSEMEQQQAKNYWPWGVSSVNSTVTEVRDYQESVSMQRADRADRAERIQFDHEEGQVQNRRFMNSRVPTWLPSSCSPIFTPTSTAASSTLGTLLTEDLNNMFLKTRREYEEKKQESHTLQLFPVRKADDEGSPPNQDGKESEPPQCNEVMNSNGCPKQFFEFL